jgi:hypothetical protein
MASTELGNMGSDAIAVVNSQAPDVSIGIAAMWWTVFVVPVKCTVNITVIKKNR